MVGPALLSGWPNIGARAEIDDDALRSVSAGVKTARKHCSSAPRLHCRQVCPDPSIDNRPRRWFRLRSESQFLTSQSAVSIGLSRGFRHAWSASRRSRRARPRFLRIATACCARLLPLPPALPARP